MKYPFVLLIPIFNKYISNLTTVININFQNVAAACLPSYSLFTVFLLLLHTNRTGDVQVTNMKQKLLIHWNYRQHNLPCAVRTLLLIHCVLKHEIWGTLSSAYSRRINLTVTVMKLWTTFMNVNVKKTAIIQNHSVRDWLQTVCGLDVNKHMCLKVVQQRHPVLDIFPQRGEG